MNACNYFWLIILVKKDTYTKKSQCSLLFTIYISSWMAFIVIQSLLLNIILLRKDIKQYSLKTKLVIVSYQKNIYINKYKMITMKMG